MGCHKEYQTGGSVIPAVAAVKIATVATDVVRRQPVNGAAKSIEFEVPDIAEFCMTKEGDL